jgi:hypothetical protein
MNHQKTFTKELTAAATSHWSNYNKMRLDFADGRMPEANPVSFYFYAEPTPCGDNEFNVQARFRKASDVSFSEADFYDGLVTGDQHGKAVVTWTQDIRSEESLAAMANDLHSISPVPMGTPVWDLSQEFAEYA